VSPPAVPCLLGPTASGKTEVGIALARRLGGEVIACDAFSVYAGLQVLTAAPEAPEDVPHHLVGVRGPEAPFSAALFVERTEALEAEIRERGKTPLIVGGTALYLRAWLKGFGAPVARDEAFRAALGARAERDGPAVLHAELEALDPLRAHEVHPNDLRRIVRALEIMRATGKPASAQREEWTGPDRRDAVLLRLVRDRDELDARIALRTERMFDGGVVEEAHALLQRSISPEAAKVLGLDVLRRLLAGEIDRDEAKASIAQKTRRFARKQETFFKSFDDVHVLHAKEGMPPEVLADEAVRIVQSS
jgi:tRNA dimethylallyltransferase